MRFIPFVIFGVGFVMQFILLGDMLARDVEPFCGYRDSYPLGVWLILGALALAIIIRIYDNLDIR